jgi:glycosyltransferase involved in cell wall biosynthesis
MPDKLKSLLIVTQAMDKEDQALGFFHRWVEEFAKHADSIIVICLKEGKHTLPQNVRVYSLGKEKGKASSFTYALRFYRLIWRERRNYADVFVHMNTEYVVLGGIFWRLWGKCIALWYAHGSVTTRLKIAVALAHCVITSSKLGMRFRTLKLKVVGQGIDTEVFKPMPHSVSESVRLITIGRISKRKGIAETLPVLDALYGRGISFTYTLVGDAVTKDDHAYMHDLKEQIAQRPYAQCVHFAGAKPHDQLPELLNQSDVFINLSQTGSMDKTVLEAIACGVATISANPAYKDLLTPFGVYVKTIDPSEIADMIVRRSDIALDTLREKVIKENSIELLVPKIISYFQ